MLADGHRSGEADLANDVRPDQVAADHVRYPEHELRNPGGKPGIGERADDFAGRSGCFLRGLGDDGATCGEGGGQLLRHQVDREIPGGEACHRSDGLGDDDRPLACRANQHTPVGALCLLGIIIEHLRRTRDFRPRLCDRLALLAGQKRGDMVGPLAHQRRGLSQDRTARLDIRRAPLWERAGGGIQCSVEVVRAGKRHLRQRCPGRRIDHIRRIAPLCRCPCTVEEQLQIGVVGAVGHGWLAFDGSFAHAIEVLVAIAKAGAASASLDRPTPSRLSPKQGIERDCVDEEALSQCASGAGRPAP